MKAERTDIIGFGDLRLIQQPGDFCYGVDAVILADFAARGMKRSNRVMDFGTGSGIIPLILSHKTKATNIIGLEIQAEVAALAQRNVTENQMAHRIQIIHGDVADIGLSLYTKWQGTMDAVVSNPPYQPFHGGIQNDNPAKTIARHEVEGGLVEFISGAARLLKPKGHLFMVHRPARMVDLFCLARKYGLEPKELKLVCPRAGEAPNLMLVHLLKAGGRELKILPTLHVYDADGAYTEEIRAIYEK